MSDLLRWFGEQSEAVKLALIGLLGGISAGFWAAVKEWRKPVLTAPAPATTPTAPRSADDPVMLILGELAALNVTLTALLVATQSEGNGQAQLLNAVTELAHQVERLRDRLNG